MLIERQRMELFPVQSLTDQYLADLDDLADRCCAERRARAGVCDAAPAGTCARGAVGSALAMICCMIAGVRERCEAPSSRGLAFAGSARFVAES